MNKTQRNQIAKQLRAAAQKLSAKPLPGDKWDEDGIQDAIKELVTVAMGRDDTAANFKLGTHDFWLLDDAVLGASNVKKHKGEAPSDDKALIKRVESEVKKALVSSPVAASTKVKAAAGVKVENPGQLRDGIWEGESISFVVSLSDFLDYLGLKHVAEFAKDGHIEVNDAPSARDLTDYGKKTSSEAITCFPDAARHAYMTAMESGTEAYLVKYYSEGVIDLLNEINGTADYEGEDSAGEAAIVKQNYSVTAEETGDVDGIYSDPYIKITVDEPLHFVNGPLADLRITSTQNVDEGYGAQSLVGDIAAYLKEEFSREVRNIGEPNTDHADMDKDIFDEFFAENVLQMNPGEIAEAIQTYADDSEESVEDVVDTMMKDIPGLHKMSGAIASALEGGYDARQQKLPLKGALKALAAAEQAIKAAGADVEYIIWGIPPGEKHENVLHTKSKSMAEAKKIIKILEEEHGCTKCHVQVLDLTKAPDFSKVLSKTAIKAAGAVSAAAPKITPKQFAGYKKAEREGGITFNDGYNVPTFGISQAVFNVISKCISTMAGASHSSNASLAEINKLLAGEKVQLARADQKLLDQAAQALSASVSAARKPTPKQQKKLDGQRIELAYRKVANGVQINMMDIPKVWEVGEKAIADGADDAALEKAIHDFVQKIKVSGSAKPVKAAAPKLTPEQRDRLLDVYVGGFTPDHFDTNERSVVRELKKLGLVQLQQGANNLYVLTHEGTNLAEDLAERYLP